MRPAIGEVVTYYTTEVDTCLAVVVTRTFWDLVTLELPDGRIVEARRVIGMLEAPNVGRFALRY